MPKEIKEQYYLISETELKQFHMAGLVAGGGDAVLPVVESIRARKCPYFWYGTDGVHCVVIHQCNHPNKEKWI
ncbi:MAG: hypothetical protein PHV93_04585 [Candidatus Pacebacteria bacterium]|nr:hypothetical protein [Candidatus Paceibacterota bacterium]